MIRIGVPTLLCLAACTCITSAARAASDIFTGAADAVFSKGANWNSGLTPTSDGTHDLLFTPAALPDGNYALNLDQSFFARSLSIGGTASRFSLFSANGSALHLANNGTLSTSVATVSIDNSVFLQGSTQLVNQLAATQNASLALNGSLTLLGGGTIISLGDRLSTTLNGSLEASAGSALSFTGPGRVIFNGNVSSNLSWIDVSGGSKALFLTESALPSSLTLQAQSGSTIAVRGNGSNNTSLLSTVLARITNPASYSGQLNLESSGSTQSYSGNLNFSGFSSSSFRLGTETSATIASTAVITPTPGGFRFGGGGGTLYVAAPLQGTTDLWFGADDGTAPSLFLQGGNTFTGKVHVSNGLLYLDGYKALPAGSSIVLGNSAYVGFTPRWTTTNSLSALIARVSKSDNASTAVIGFDALNPLTGSTSTSGLIDLSGFANPIYLGSSSYSAVILANATLKGPADGILRLAALRGSTLELRNSLTGANGINSLTLGHPDPVLSGTPGTYILSGNNNYTGGTRVNSGTLEVGASSATPLGSGAVTLSGATLRLGSSSGAVRSADLNNAIVFEGSGNRITGTGVINTRSRFSVGNGNWLAPGYSTMSNGQIRALGFRQALDFGQGGGLEVKISNPAGAAGVDYSLVGSFDKLSFSSTQLNPFTFKLVSYSLSGSAGTLQPLTPGTTYSLVLAMASNGITGFDSSAIMLDTSAFLTGEYAVSNYSFSLKSVSGGEQLILSFTPIPEPETWALMLLGSGSLAIPLLRRLRRRA